MLSSAACALKARRCWAVIAAAHIFVIKTATGETGEFYAHTIYILRLSDTMDKHRWPSTVYTLCASACAHDFSWTPPRHRHLCNCCQRCWGTTRTRMWHGNVLHLLTNIMLMMCVHMLDGITLLYLWLKISSQSECTASLSHRCKHVSYQPGWSIIGLVCNLSHN